MQREWRGVRSNKGNVRSYSVKRILERKARNSQPTVSVTLKNNLVKLQAKRHTGQAPTAGKTSVEF